MKRKLSHLFIILAAIHLNLIVPVSKASDSSGICIMDNGVYMAHHSDNKKIHDHRGQNTHHGHHGHNGIHQIKMDCNMDMSSSDIYFPGGEHPFMYETAQTPWLELPYIEAVLSPQAQIIEGFITSPYNPPRFIS